MPPKHMSPKRSPRKRKSPQRSPRKSPRKANYRFSPAASDDCDTTMHGLKIWYTRMLEQLGWMVLAKKRGYTDKIESYLRSLERLDSKIKCKFETIHNEDKKVDLGIMQRNVSTLLQHAYDDFQQGL